MKFIFNIQQYQTKAVESVTDVFKGHTKKDSQYIIDKGFNNNIEDYFDNKYGYGNGKLSINEEQILSNIKEIQNRNGLKISNSLNIKYGKCSLNVSMETGTGKTYVYIKTIYELNKLYGWNKFIIIVPNVAIREGVKKSFEITEEHFKLHYKKLAKYFVYDSKQLQILEDYSTSEDIYVMIINSQAFTGKDDKLINIERDEFQSRKPIEVISNNRPILILDEPQKLDGKETRDSIKNFNPLFSISYSATHKELQNLVYSLDPLDAYQQKLVKRIEVKGIEKNSTSTASCYIYFSALKLSKDKEPQAIIEIEVNKKSNIIKKEFTVTSKSDLYKLSNEMEQYKGIVVLSIDAKECKLYLSNNIEIYETQKYGDIEEPIIRRIQIRETIKSHFEKEQMLFNQNIKTLSLFFIDKVVKYRQYDENGNQMLGEYAKIFEEEYKNQLENLLNTLDKDSPYYNYLTKNTCSEVHNGYFSIDKKTKREKDDFEAKTLLSKDVDAYDLILKNKEKLLSFNEPTRFIFSHSALREGWDNPNIFQICTLKNSNNEAQKHQEVGRGLRLCVNQDGTRIDYNYAKENVMDINLLTVIASESYESFVSGLQGEIIEGLTVKPLKITGKEVFINKPINDSEDIITEQQAQVIYNYLIRNDYIDDYGTITETYKEAKENNTIKDMAEKDKSLQPTVIAILNNIVENKTTLNEMIFNNARKVIVENKLNENFNRKEFQDLWNKIHYKCVYRVEIDREKIVEKVVNSIENNLNVRKTIFNIKTGKQNEEINRENIKEGTSFTQNSLENDDVDLFQNNVKYDLLGEISKKAKITRKTIAEILTKISDDKFNLYKVNPDEFIKNVSNIIIEAKSEIVIDNIKYKQIDEVYETSIFATHNVNYCNSILLKNMKKHIQDNIICDSKVEEQFARDLENSKDVIVYSKLPRGFRIPTPVGDYSPDWAIVFDDKNNGIKCMYFIAETKGSINKNQLRDSENNKIACAYKFHDDIYSATVTYEVVASYDDLITHLKK